MAQQANALVNSMQQQLYAGTSGSPGENGAPAGTWAIQFNPASKVLTVMVTLTPADSAPAYYSSQPTLDDLKNLYLWLGAQMALMASPKSPPSSP